jgi:hypothetical protein
MARKGFVSKFFTKNDAVSQVAESTEKIINKTSRRGNATERQQIDMLSDSRLSKSVRPVIMYWLMALVTTLLICDAFGVKFSQYLVEKILFGFIAAIMFYFPGRIAEKFIKKSEGIGLFNRKRGKD